MKIKHVVTWDLHDTCLPNSFATQYFQFRRLAEILALRGVPEKTYTFSISPNLAKNHSFIGP